MLKGIWTPPNCWSRMSASFRGIIFHPTISIGFNPSFCIYFTFDTFSHGGRKIRIKEYNCVCPIEDQRSDTSSVVAKTLYLQWLSRQIGKLRVCENCFVAVYFAISFVFIKISSWLLLRQFNISPSDPVLRPAVCAVCRLLTEASWQQRTKFSNFQVPKQIISSSRVPFKSSAGSEIKLFTFLKAAPFLCISPWLQ